MDREQKIELLCPVYLEQRISLGALAIILGTVTTASVFADGKIESDRVHGGVPSVSIQWR